MANLVLLGEKISDSGKSKEFYADALGLSTQGFLNKLNGKTDFCCNEAKRLCEILHITSAKEKIDIFLNNE